jgi:hypothetical protein
LNYSDGLAEETNTHPFTPSRLVDFYLRRLIDLCHKNNIIIVYKTMPFNENSYKSIKPEYFEAYLSNLKKLPLRSPDIVDETVRMYANQYFGDPSHLNHSGAEKFSRELKVLLDTLM